jgi:hypothetical protein
MTLPVSIPIENENAGMYFACCGLFELLHHLSLESPLAWFDEQAFCISVGAEAIWAAVNKLDQAIKSLNKPTRSKGEEGPPICLELGKRSLVLDWWLTNHELKTWSGRQGAYDFLLAMTGEVARLEGGDNGITKNLWARTWSRKGVMPFYFDSVLKDNTQLDLGFSTNGHFQVLYSPAVELLTFLGLQRFRPRLIDNPTSRKVDSSRRVTRGRFNRWRKPLPIAVASVVAFGSISSADAFTDTYDFQVLRRTGDKHKAIGRASLMTK